MQRRTALKGLSALGIVSTLPSWKPFYNFKYKLGLQLYTIRDAMEKDPINSLKYTKELGYQDFETYGYDTENQSYYGFHAKDLKRILDDLGLTTTSGHYRFSDHFGKPLEQLLEYTKKCIEGAHILEKKYITWPWIDPQYRNMESYKLLCEKLNRMGELAKNSNIGFAYHNHGFEFDIRDENGHTGYDYLLNNTDPELVKLQMDFYWIMHSSKKNPKQWIDSQKGRVVMWHIKDMDKVSRDYTELGKGSIDYHKILPSPEASGLEYYYLEQGGNFKINSLESIKESATYFKKELQQYL